MAGATADDRGSDGLPDLFPEADIPDGETCVAKLLRQTAPSGGGVNPWFGDGYGACGSGGLLAWL
jgi:hypothetical protein